MIVRQYNVFVKNETGEKLKVAFKTLNDRNGEINETIELSPGESRQIITSIDIDTGEGCTGVQPSHCSFVTEYVNAFIQDSIPSQLTWCDEKIQFIHEDILQGSFTINYRKDFNPTKKQ